MAHVKFPELKEEQICIVYDEDPDVSDPYARELAVAEACGKKVLPFIYKRLTQVQNNINAQRNLDADGIQRRLNNLILEESKAERIVSVFGTLGVGKSSCLNALMSKDQATRFATGD